jgi:hypothetical protein
VLRCAKARAGAEVAAGMVMTNIMTSVAILSLAACSGGRAARIPSDLPDDAPPPAPAELSRFSVPLSYDFSTILPVIDRAVPTTFGSIDSVHTVGNDTRRHYAFQADRQNFVAYAEGDLVHLRAVLSYTARGFYKPLVGPTVSGGCGNGKPEERPRILIELATPLTLSSDWHLSSHARLVTIEPASSEQRDRCDVTLLHHDVTDRVLDAARAGISAHLADIDRKIAEVDLREKLAGAWSSLANPIRIAGGTWLTLNPSGLAIGRVTGRAHVLTMPVTLEARPEIVTMAAAPTTSAAAFPPLGATKRATGFHVVLDGSIDYVAASALASAALIGHKVNEAQRTVRVTGASLAPAAKGRVVLSVAFDGDAKGTLRFIGTPVIDSVRRELAIPDLDYDLTTSDRVVSTVAWLRSDMIRGMFRERSHFPVDSVLRQGRALLLAALNRRIGDALTLSASVDSVAVRGVFVTRTALVIRGVATGKAAVAVRQR